MPREEAVGGQVQPPAPVWGVAGPGETAQQPTPILLSSEPAEAAKAAAAEASALIPVSSRAAETAQAGTGGEADEPALALQQPSRRRRSDEQPAALPSLAAGRVKRVPGGDPMKVGWETEEAACTWHAGC